MKRLVLLSTIIISSTIAFGQAYQGKLDYDKKKQEAIVIDYSYPQEAVENAIIDKIENLGNRAREEKGMFNKDKGCIVFKNANVSEISDEMMDYIVKVERRSRKEKDESTLYLIINKGGQDMLVDDALRISKAKSFLNSLTPDIENAHLDIKIKDQEGTVAKAEKKLKDLQNDQSNMEKKIKNLQDDLKENAKDQEAQQKEIVVQKESLEGLKTKRGK